MSKKTVPYRVYAKTLAEAQAVADTVKTEGWKVLEADLLREAAKIQELLVENRLRTVQQTVTTRDGTQTLITTAETQIAENAGMYKMIKFILEDIKAKIEAPEKLAKMEREGLVVIEKADGEIPPPTASVKAPPKLEKIRKRIKSLLKGGEA